MKSKIEIKSLKDLSGAPVTVDDMPWNSIGLWWYLTRAIQDKPAFCRGACQIGMLTPGFISLLEEALLEAMKSAHTVAVIDRNVSLRIGGIIAREVKAALFNSRRDLRVSSVISGIGGLDITPNEVSHRIMALLQNSHISPGGVENTI